METDDYDDAFLDEEFDGWAFIKELDDDVDESPADGGGGGGGGGALVLIGPHTRALHLRHLGMMLGLLLML